MSNLQVVPPGKCEGDGGVVGVVTPLLRGSAQILLHGDQVVRARCAARKMHDKREMEKDGESKIKKKCTWMTMRMG